MSGANDALVAKLLTAPTQVERIADIPVRFSFSLFYGDQFTDVYAGDVGSHRLCVQLSERD